jgi:beta-phosphoglucomutase
LGVIEMPAASALDRLCLCGSEAHSVRLMWNEMVDMREALVFDYDGVIADTEPLHWKSWAVLLAPYGIEFGWDEYCRVGRGVSDEAIFARFRKQLSEMDAAALSSRNNERKQMVSTWSLAESPISTETVALLKSLAGNRIGLVTSSNRVDVEPVLRSAGIYDCFGAMVFGEEPAAPKPSAAPYLLIAERLGVKTGIAFEDSEPGLASARAAGFNAIRIVRPCDLPQMVEMSLRGAL